MQAQDFSPAWARDTGFPPPRSSASSSVAHQGARPRTTTSVQPETAPVHSFGNPSTSTQPPGDAALGEHIIAGFAGVMSGVMQDFSNTVSGAINGRHQNLEQSKQGLRQEMTATTAHAPLLDTIDRFAMTHPPPMGPRNPPPSYGQAGHSAMGANPPPLRLRDQPPPPSGNQPRYLPTQPTAPRHNYAGAFDLPSQPAGHDFNFVGQAGPLPNYTMPPLPNPPPQDFTVPKYVPPTNPKNHHDTSDSDAGNRRRRTRDQPRNRDRRRRDDSWSSDSSSRERLSNASGYGSRESHQSRRSQYSGYHNGNHRGNYRGHSGQHTRLPPFTAQEPWKVYYNRFKDVAALYGWTEQEKLRELLPRLQGKAGEFVYGQLSRGVRSDFKQLVQELKHRFRKVETAKTYGAQFSNRSQHQGESVEDYAAELKRLYDKAHANRDKETRREDLLRRFLDGLLDDRARFQVEFTKEPEDIDDAVYEVVNFLETRKRTKASSDQSDRKNRRPARAVRDNSSEGSGTDVSSEDEVRAIQNQRYQNKGSRNQPGNGKGKPPSVSKDTQPKESQDYAQLLEQLKVKIEQLEKLTAQPPSATGATQATAQPRVRGPCFRCGQEGHFARDCQNPRQPSAVNPTPAAAVTNQAAGSGNNNGNSSTSSAQQSTNC